MKTFNQIWIFSLAIKLALSAILPLTHDEAYYWFWGHHLQLSYYDHPPFVAWIFYLGQIFEGLGQAVRWPGVLLGHLIVLIWVKILSPFFNTRQLNWFLVLTLCAPLTGPGSIIITPDIPLVLFWSICVYLFIRLIEEPSKSLYFLFGLSFGLGFSSKYHIVLFAPIALYLLWKKNKWNLLWRPGVELFFIAVFIGASPVIIWNVQNDFISFLFQLKHGLKTTSWRPYWPLSYLLGQALLVFPTVIYFAFKKNSENQPYFLKILAVFPFAFFFLTSFRSHVEANWPIVAYPAMIALAVSQTNTKNMKWVRWTCSFWLMVLIFVLIQVFSPGTLMSEKWLRTREFNKYDSLVTSIRSHVLEEGPLYARTYQMAAKLSYDLDRRIYKLRGMSRVDFFDFRVESLPPKHRFYLVMKLREKLPVSIKKNYRRIEVLPGGEEYEIVLLKSRPEKSLENENSEEE